MKNLSGLIPVLMILAFVGATSCGPTDNSPPYIYILGEGGIIVGTHDNPYDTTVLLYTKYVEPTKEVGDYTFVGIQYEDNATRSADLIVESTIESLLTTGAGYLRRQGSQTITYSVTDEAGNTQTAERNLSIVNIADAFRGRYETSRSSLRLQDTTYNSNIAVDALVPGRLRFPRVYNHYDSDNNHIFYRVDADLWSPHISTEFSTAIAYMGKSNADRDTPFFESLSFEEGMDTILTFQHLRIDAQDYTDTLGNMVAISGVTVNGVPESRIEYVGDSKTIARIVLRYNYSNYQTGVTDNVTEVYVPN